MIRVALTGNIASGKSTVARVWQSLGAVLIDADELARRVVLPGTATLQSIVTEFGAAVLNEDGTLDRAALRGIVFSDEVKRRRLEGILHPAIQRLREREELALQDGGHKIVVHDIPLLFELGMEKDFDIVVLVDAPEAVRLERLQRDRALSASAAQEMIDAQAPAAGKRAGAHYIIENDSAVAALQQRAQDTWRRIKDHASE